MATVTAKYLGDLRVECTHVASGTKLVSDAPVDNNGKGEAFSPTDLCVTALASCAMTIIGIYGKTVNQQFISRILCRLDRGIENFGEIYEFPVVVKTGIAPLAEYFKMCGECASLRDE